MSYSSENLKPVGRSVFVEIIDPADIIASGGLVVKATIEYQEAKGIVLAVGPANDMCVSVGDAVLLSKSDPIEIVYNGKRCRLVRDGEILAVLKKE